MPVFETFWQWLGWITIITIPPTFLMMAADVIFNISGWKRKTHEEESTTH